MPNSLTVQVIRQSKFIDYNDSRGTNVHHMYCSDLPESKISARFAPRVTAEGHRVSEKFVFEP